MLKKLYYKSFKNTKELNKHHQIKKNKHRIYVCMQFNLGVYIIGTCIYFK